MLTYVINTSENKVLKSEVLFDLVGYNKIVWMRSGLSAVADCADEILRRQQPMTAGEYRVVVLVDFLAFEKTLYPEENPVSEYLTIYRKLIEIYLYDHLYTPLRRAQLGFDGLEVFYIQYSEKNTIRENAAEKYQVAELLGLPAEVKRIVGEKQKASLDAASPKSADVAKSKKKDEEKPVESDLERYTAFHVEYRGGGLTFRAEDFCKNVGEGKGADYESFYRSYIEKHVHAYRAFGSRSRTYVAESASARMESRAAFDNLNLSLALIHAYEQEMSLSGGEDKRDDVVDVPKMNRNAFFDVIRKAYGKVQSALELVRQSGKANGFYRLETSKTTTDDICRSELSEEEKKEAANEARATKFSTQYLKIKECAATRPGEKKDGEKEQISRYMSAYKDKRDETRNHTTEEDVRALLSDAPMQSKYPSGLEYENAVEKKKATMRTIYKTAIEADYKEANYSKEFEESHEVYDRYTRADAALSKNFRIHLGCLILVLIAMIVPYLVLQQTNFSKVGAVLLLTIAALVFGGVYIFSAFIHIIPLLRARRLAKERMTELYESCLLKQKRSMLELRRRYEVYLPAVEEIRYEIYTLSVLHEANREINRHIEEHREMLEKLRDVLLGMLNSMQVTYKADGEVMLDDDEFKINESFRANKIYKVFTLDTIEEIFAEGGM